MYFLARGIRNPNYFRRFGERWGFLPSSFHQTGHAAIWLHAVSVGEVLGALALLRGLKRRFPFAPLYVSTTTLAGRALAEEKLAGLADGVFYAPFDFCFVVRRVLRKIRPKVLVVMETEIWPNLFREARRTGCGLLMVNGRISDRAWPRYRALQWFFRPILELPQAILAQTELSRERFLALGAPAANVRVAGNLKYDFDPRGSEVPGEVARLLERCREKEVWIAASTMPPAHAGDADEDDLVIEAFRALAPAHPRLLLLLAPRRPDRFDAVAGKLQTAGISFLRRSALNPNSALALPGVLLLDSIGELSSLFALADVVFMGGTLAHRGGHNILEPAFHSRAVVVGPHMENFHEIAAKFLGGGGCLEVADRDELARVTDELLRHPERRAELGTRALDLARGEQGAAGRALDAIGRLYGMAVPRRRPPLPLLPLLWLLARCWDGGSRWKRRRALARRVTLATPVISVGGLSAGGAGKSPLTLWLAERLRAAGYRPAILTRGYKRRESGAVTILDAGAEAPVAVTGDEAQAYLRAGVGPVGIRANRAEAGRLLEERCHPGVFLLDDGFQHWQLARTVDIVVIDALDPFAGGDLIPFGRLRELPDALARADVVVITKAEAGHPLDGIKAAIRKHASSAPIFTSRLAPVGWVDAGTGQTVSPGRAAAFCGLGNPGSFWQTLAISEAEVVFRQAFPDHHRYSRRELEWLAAKARAAGAGTLLTTEKDASNLCPDWAQAIAPLRLCWLKIGVEMDGAEAFMHAVACRLQVPAASA